MNNVLPFSLGALAFAFLLVAVALDRLLRQREAATRSSVGVAAAGAGGSGALPKITFETEDDEADATRVATNPGARVPLDATILQSFVDDDAVVDEPTHVSALIVTSAQSRTDRGLRRRRNEDSLLVLDKHGVFVVADGMGGYAGGDRASHLAVDVVAETFEKNAFGPDEHPRLPRRGTQLARAIQLANDAILEEARSAPSLKGMGTTVVAARFSNNKQRLYIAHVGDSRIYRLRNDELVPLTEDHTMGALGVTGPGSVLLSRAVGIGPNLVVDIGVVKPVPGDRYLLCSDGLTKMVSPDEISAILGSRANLSEAVEALVEASNAHGGRDNVTVIVVQVDAPAAS